MMYVVSIAVFAACVKLLLAGVDVKTVAGIFAAGKILIALALGGGVASVLITAVIIAVISFGYFWLLRRVEGSSGRWWAVLVLGAILIA